MISKIIQMKARMKCNDGLSLVELMIVAALLVVVLSGGYILFSFGYDSFFIAQGRSDVQQNVRIASDYIVRETRNARTMTLISDTESIPAPNEISAGDHYIFLNSDGKLEHRTKNISEIVPEGISERITFDVTFSVSVSNNRILAYEIIGIRDNGQTNTLISEIFLENLAFQGYSINVIGNDTKGVFFNKDAAATVIALSVNPDRVEENPFMAQPYDFIITLVNEKFANPVLAEHIELLDDLLPLDGINMIGNPERIDDQTIIIHTNGILKLEKGIGTVRVLADGLVNGDALEAKVLIMVPVGYLAVRPSEVNAANELDSIPVSQTYTLDLEAYENEFNRTLLTTDVALGGDFEVLQVDKIWVLNATELVDSGYDPVNKMDKIARIELTGPLVMNDLGTGYGHAYIRLGTDIEGDVFQSGFALTGLVTVWPSAYTIMYKLSVGIKGEGKTDPLPGEYVKAPNDFVILTASKNADSKWEFYEWTVNSETKIHDDLNKITIKMDGNKGAVAHFRLPFKEIPMGQHVKYNNQPYIKISDSRLMDFYQSANTMQWSLNTSWPTRDELLGISQTDRSGAGNYWTGTDTTGNNAYYVDNSGVILTRKKTDTINQRPCITVTSDSLYAYSGDGSAANPFVVY